MIVFPVLAFSPLRADEDAWEAIAEDAAIVVRVKNPRQFIDEISAFCEFVQKGSQEQVRAIVSLVGETFSNPEFAGVDRDLSWWVAIYPAEDDRPPDIVLILPTTNEKGLQAALGKNVHVVKHGKYIAYSTDAVVDKTAAKLRQEGNAVAALLDRESRALFDSGECSVLINAPVLSRAYQAQSENKREIEGGRGNFSRRRPSAAARVFTQATVDMQSVTIAASVSADGVVLECLVRMRSGTLTTKLLPKSASELLDDIEALPPGGVIYASAIGDWARLWWRLAPDWENDLNRVLGPSTALIAAEAGLRELNFDSIAYSTRMSEFNGNVENATITRTTEVQSFRKLSLQLARATNGSDTATFRWTVETKIADERYGDDVADIFQYRRLFRNPSDARFVPQNWATRKAYRPGVVAETSGADPEDMRHILNALALKEKVRSVNRPLNRTRRKLDLQADAVVLLDAPRACVKIVDEIFRGVAQAISDQLFFGLPVGASQNADEGGESSYCGVSVVGRPDGDRIRIFIPLEQIQRFAQMLESARVRGTEMKSNSQDPEVD